MKPKFKYYYRKIYKKVKIFLIKKSSWKENFSRGIHRIAMTTKTINYESIYLEKYNKNGLVEGCC